MAANPDDLVLTYLRDLAFRPNDTRLRFEYRTTFDQALGTMNTQLRVAYEDWRDFRDAAVVLDHLESIQATCDQRLNPVCKAQYHRCITMLRAEISRAGTPEVDHQDAHFTASPALADVHIKDPTYAVMQDVPALLASLHGLSAFEDVDELRRAQREDREEATREQQQREHREQQKVDEAAALHLRQYQQRREEDERRRVMQAEAAKAR
jgi:hypothetical protein